MISIGENIKKLPKKELKKWIAVREKENRNQDWKETLAKLKERYVQGTGAKSEND